MKIACLLFTVFAFNTFANEIDSNCGDIETFFPYKAGVQAEKDQFTEEAFSIFCNLAFKGDYRAQNKLAEYYFYGVPELIEPNYEFAYIWSKLSNAYIVSKKRTEFTEEIYLAIDEFTRPSMNTKVEKALKIIPIGARIDMQYKPIDYAKVIEFNKKRLAKKTQTGSHIKRKKPILNTQIFDF